MKTINIKHYLVAAALCCGVATALTACAEWDDHYDGGASTGSDLTLWQQLQGRQELSEFCKLLEQTKVFRMHKKTVVSYADLLNGGQSFTVVAPVNGSFNCDSLLKLVETNQGDSVVEKSFVLNHISRSTTSLRSDEQTMLLLNSKYVTLGGDAIQGVTVKEANVHARNGVIHVAAKPLPYQINLYEALCDLPEMTGVGSVLRQYEQDYFDADASVSSGIVEGVPVYVDSVVYEYNRMLERIGLIDAEDSLYWVVAPNTGGWQKAWNEASKYFVYDSSVLKNDSIQQYWTTRALMSDAIFNLRDQRSTEDSLVSVPYLSWRRQLYVPGKPISHVFHKPFAEGGILNGAEKISCSNGVLYKVDEWPFTPEQTYLQPIWTEGERVDLITEYNDKLCSYNVRREVGDSISEDSYLQIVPSTSTANWTITFRLNNNLATDYDVCAVLLPKTVSNANDTDLRPCKFRATIKYADATGKMQEFNCNKTTFVSDPEKVDTIVLAENFHFPVCNYDQSAIKATVTLTCYISAKETSRYDREMYLDCIYLRPRISKVE